MDLQTLSGVTGAFNAAGLTLDGSNKQNVTFTNATELALNGTALSVAATQEVALTGTSLAASQTCVFLICSAGGTSHTAVQSEIVANSDLTDRGLAIQLPDIPDGNVPVGYAKVSTNASGAFIPGTTNLDTANVFDVYVDFLGGIVDRAVQGVATGA